MASSLTQTFLHRAALFNAGDFATLSEFFRVPCAVYLRNDLQVVVSRCKMQEMLRRYSSFLQSIGVHSIQPKLVAVSLVRNNRQSAWIEWLHLDSQGVLIKAHLCQYVLRLDSANSSPVIELVDYVGSQGDDHVLGTARRRSA